MLDDSQALNHHPYLSLPCASRVDEFAWVNCIFRLRFSVRADETDDGRRQVGVLFGDGPIGIKLGENPLKATGVCRVYVTEVRSGERSA